MHAQRLNTGIVTAVRGSVVNVCLAGALPPIHSVLHAGSDDRIVIEVLTRRDARHVRGIALIYKTHQEAEEPARRPMTTGFDPKTLSTIGKSHPGEQHPVGYHTSGDRVESWGDGAVRPSRVFQ